VRTHRALLITLPLTYLCQTHANKDHADYWHCLRSQHRMMIIIINDDDDDDDGGGVGVVVAGAE
jgi:hypothetical protein